MQRLKFLMPLLLTACASEPALLGSAPSTEVKVAVAVRCVQPGDIPAPPKTAMPRKGDVKQNAAGAAADVYALEAANARMYALLQACATATEADRGTGAK